MRKYTLSAGMLLATLSVPLLAQDEAQPPTDMPEPPPVAPPQLTPAQQTTFDSWPPEQQAGYASWPGDVQAYYWNLPEPRQEVFWRLTDNDKVSLARMEPVDQVTAWELVEKRLQGDAAAEPPPMQEKPDGS